MESVERLDLSGQSPGGPHRLDNMPIDFQDIVHSLPGNCLWTQWKVWTLSMDTLGKVQVDRTMSTESMDSMDKVHSVLSELVKKNLR